MPRNRSRQRLGRGAKKASGSGGPSTHRVQRNEASIVDRDLKSKRGGTLGVQLDWVNRRLLELGRISGIMVTFRSYCNSTPSTSADHAVAGLMSPKRFDLHAEQRIHGNDRRQLERTLRYCLRGPLSEQRLSILDDGTVQVAVKKGLVRRNPGIVTDLSRVPRSLGGSRTPPP